MKYLKFSLFNHFWKDKVVDVNEHISDYFTKEISSDVMKYCFYADYSSLQSVIANGSKNVNKVVTELFGMTPLLLATFYGHASIVELLIDNGANINSELETFSKETAMVIAIHYGYLDIINLLLKSGYSLFESFKYSHFGNNAFEYAIIVQNANEALKAAIIETFVHSCKHDSLKLRCLLNYNEKNDQAYYLLLRLAKRSEKKIIELLMNCLYFSRDRVLKLAVKGNSMPLVESLLASGANVNVRYENEWSLYKHALLHHFEEIADLLVKYGATKEDLRQDLLIEAIQNENIESVQYYLDSGADPNCVTSGEIPLFEAIDSDNEEILKLLIRYKARHITNGNDDGPVAFAVRNDKIRSLRVLLENSFDPNELSVASIERSRKINPLFYANNIENLKLLVKYKADVNQPTYPDEKTVLFHCIYNNFFDCVKYLIEETDVNINFQDFLQETPLHNAVRYPKIVQYLLKNGASAGTKCRNGCTPLHSAVIEGVIESVILLLEAGTTPNDRNNFGEVPLHLASVIGLKKVATKLIKHENACVNIIDLYKNTPLHLASAKGHLNIVQALIEAGAALNRVNTGGAKPLHLASYNDHKDVVNCLLQAGANRHLFYERKEMSSICVDKGNFKIAQILRPCVKKSEIPIVTVSDTFQHLLFSNDFTNQLALSVINKSLRLVEKIVELVSKKDNLFEGAKVYLSGSCGEMSKVGNPDEIDIIILLPKISTNVEIDELSVEGGYCSLMKKEPCDCKYLLDLLEYDGRISPYKLKATLIHHIEDIFHFQEIKDLPEGFVYYFTADERSKSTKVFVDEHKAGCVLTFYYRCGILSTLAINIDLIPVLEIKDKCKSLFNLTSISSSLLESRIGMKNKKHLRKSIFLVPTSVNGDYEESLKWQFSASHLEVSLFISLPKYQKHVYLVSKLLIKQFDGIVRQYDLSNFPSYYIKNMFFTEVAEFPNKSEWAGNKVRERLINLFYKVFMGLEKYDISSFFVENYFVLCKNLLSNKEWKHIIKCILTFLEELSEDSLKELRFDPRQLLIMVTQNFDYEVSKKDALASF